MQGKGTTKPVRLVRHHLQWCQSWWISVEHVLLLCWALQFLLVFVMLASTVFLFRLAHVQLFSMASRPPTSPRRLPTHPLATQPLPPLVPRLATCSLIPP